MLRLEIDSIQEGRKLILDTEEDIRVDDLIKKTEQALESKGCGLLISCDKEGVLPLTETLTNLNIVSGERLLYIKRE